MDNKKYQDQLSNLIKHSQKISDVMSKINERMEKWNEKKKYLISSLTKISEDINEASVDNIMLEVAHSKSSVSLELNNDSLTGGDLIFAPTLHYRIASYYLRPHLQSEGEVHMVFLRDYDVDELEMDVIFKEVENYMGNLKHFFEKGS